jgi:hypothetical protein
MLNATLGAVLVLYRRVFEPGGNYSDLETPEPLAGMSFHKMSV